MHMVAKSQGSMARPTRRKTQDAAKRRADEAVGLCGIPSNAGHVSKRDMPCVFFPLYFIKSFAGVQTMFVRISTALSISSAAMCS